MQPAFFNQDLFSINWIEEKLLGDSLGVRINGTKGLKMYRARVSQGQQCTGKEHMHWRGVNVANRELKLLPA